MRSGCPTRPSRLLRRQPACPVSPRPRCGRTTRAAPDRCRSGPLAGPLDLGVAGVASPTAVGDVAAGAADEHVPAARCDEPVVPRSIRQSSGTVALARGEDPAALGRESRSPPRPPSNPYVTPRSRRASRRPRSTSPPRPLPRVAAVLSDAITVSRSRPAPRSTRSEFGTPETPRLHAGPVPSPACRWATHAGTRRSCSARQLQERPHAGPRPTPTNRGGRGLCVRGLSRGSRAGPANGSGGAAWTSSSTRSDGCARASRRRPCRSRRASWAGRR